jgi:hypothetical protein
MPFDRGRPPSGHYNARCQTTPLSAPVATADALIKVWYEARLSTAVSLAATKTAQRPGAPCSSNNNHGVAVPRNGNRKPQNVL